MVTRESLPYLGVMGLGTAFVAVASYGLLALAGDEGIGVGIGRAVLTLFLVLGAVGILVAGIDLYRHHVRD